MATSAAFVIARFCKGSSSLQLSLMLIGAVAAVFWLTGSSPISNKISVLSKPTFLIFAASAFAVFGIAKIVRLAQR